MHLRPHVLGLFGLFSLLASACSGTTPGSTEESGSAIVGGHATSDSPAVGYLNLLLKDKASGRAGVTSPFCTATLIAPKVVLTAGHCAEAMDTMPDEVAKAGMKLGAFLFGTGGWKDQNAVVVTKWRAHPYFARPLPAGFQGPDKTHDYEHDMAYAVLAEPVQGVTPAQVSFARHNGGCTYTSLGYGVSTRGYVESLNNHTNPVSGIRKALDTCADSDLTFGMIPVASPTGATCNGDSGGPLLLRGKEVIYGVVSWGEEPCDSKHVTMYTPIETNLDFVGEALHAGD